VFMRILYGIYLSTYAHIHSTADVEYRAVRYRHRTVPPQTRRAAALRDTLELLEEAYPPCTLEYFPRFPGPTVTSAIKRYPSGHRWNRQGQSAEVLGNPTTTTARPSDAHIHAVANPLI
jgi:hypothetical protein